MDISSRKDIEIIIDSFYKQLLVDKTVGYLFTEIAKINLETHLPALVDFWEDQLFGTNNYTGNPMRVHMHLHQKSELKDGHFNQWLMLFNKTVEDSYSGPKAHLIKERALSIATVMRIKIAR